MSAATLDDVVRRMNILGWTQEATLLAVTAAAGRISQKDLEFLANELTKAERPPIDAGNIDVGDLEP